MRERAAPEDDGVRVLEMTHRLLAADHNDTACGLVFTVDKIQVTLAGVVTCPACIAAPPRTPVHPHKLRGAL